jgi:hypothetical protein
MEPDDGDLDLSFAEPVENLDLLDDLPDVSGPLDGSKKVTAPALETPSKKVRKRFRRSDRNDKEALEKIQAFVVTPDMPNNPALVAILNPSDPPSKSPSIVRDPSLPKPSNDNLIPVWEKSSDWVKLCFAVEALEASGRPAVSFTLDLAPANEKAALSHPKGFTESLKRELDVELQRELGYKPLYLFGADVASKDRLHLHGGIAAHPHELPAIKRALLSVGGEWGSKRHPDKQLDINTQRCDWGWAEYLLKKQGAVRKVLKGRTYTITGPLRAEARELYGNCRDAMRILG